MKVFLFTYSKLNFGDDLFIKLLLDKYPNIDFEMHIKDIYTKPFKNYKNATFLDYKEKLKSDRLNSIDTDKYDCYVYIGGSIFMEHCDNGILGLKLFTEFIKKVKSKGKPFYYINCNFGPYKTNEYLNVANQLFNECEDICFRDKTSFDLFNTNKKRHAKDSVYMLKKIKRNIVKNTVGISVISIENREDLKKYNDEYIKLLRNNIKYYIDNGKEIYLYSFCEHEKDLEQINNIYQKFSSEYNKKIKIVNYNGDIDKYLDLYASMEYMMCTRFHSMILSSCIGQKYTVLSYSNKIDTVMKEYKLSGNIDKIQNINENKIFELNIYKEDKNIDFYKDAKKQFAAFDKFVNKGLK